MAKPRKPVSEVVRSNVQGLRRQRGLTQEGLCERAGISADAVGRIESGSRVPTLETLDRLAAALKVQVADLVHVGRLPAPKQAAAIRRIVTALEQESSTVQSAAEQVVKVVVKALAPQKRKRKRK